MTIVPPFPHDEIADVIAGTSSVDEEPPAFGVQVAARAPRDFVDSGSARAPAKSAKSVNDFRHMVVFRTQFTCASGNYAADTFISISNDSLNIDVSDPNRHGGFSKCGIIHHSPYSRNNSHVLMIFTETVKSMQRYCKRALSLLSIDRLVLKWCVGNYRRNRPRMNKKKSRPGNICLNSITALEQQM